VQHIHGLHNLKWNEGAYHLLERNTNLKQESLS
jgi:hypothetical protein